MGRARSPETGASSSTTSTTATRTWVVWSVALAAYAGGYTPEAFRAAWTVQYPVWAFAVVAVLGSRRLARRKLVAEGVVILPRGGAGAVAESSEPLTPTPS